MKKRSIIVGTLFAVLLLLLTTGCDLNGDSDTEVTNVVFQGAIQNGGTTGTADSTALTLTFDVDPTTLTTNNITITGASMVGLIGSGTTRSIVISDITVGNGDTVSIEITNPLGYSISGSPQITVVYRELNIGMAYLGGIIAYILQLSDPNYVSGEMHGLIAATGDQSTSIVWWNGSYTTTGATGTVLGTGQANTTAIVTNQGTGNYAAQICDDYTNADTGIGVYSDWYLPSQDELKKLILNKDAIGGFDSDYWSSSEQNDSSAFYLDSGGSEWFTSKADTYRVRAVRAF